MKTDAMKFWKKKKRGGFEGQNKRDNWCNYNLKKKERKLRLKEISLSHADCSHLKENK